MSRQLKLLATMLACMTLVGNAGAEQLGKSAVALDGATGSFAHLEALGDELNAHINDYSVGFDDSSQAVTLLQQEWAVVQNWAVDFLSHYRLPTPETFKSRVGSLGSKGGLADSDIRAEFVSLGTRIYLVEITALPTNSLFIVAPSENKLRVVWTINETGETERRKLPLLNAWSSNAARESCKDKAFEDHSNKFSQCGPLWIEEIGKLPDSNDGAHRFYVSAGYARAAGCDGTSQLSIWEWHAERATPLLVKNYPDYCDGSGVQFDGQILHVDVKEQFKTFGSYASDPARQMDWRIRISPHSVRDLGKIPRVPELDVIDRFIDRLRAGKSTDKLSSTEAAALLKGTIKHGPHQSKSGVIWNFPGVVDNYEVTRKGKISKVCISLDNWGTYLFAIKAEVDGPYISHIENLGSQNGCQT